ncbi:MAG TPA: class IV adenylate cyclase [Pirellulales bacterium]|jgi:predicted adenylyl cyclase CyaB|nr:class IV adenylate cyclase [Pirellulales bacterium]
MPANVEIKARVPDMTAIRGRVESIGAGPAEVLDQEDVFFAAPGGRLKLRIFGPGRGELIFYQRGDTAGPKTSTYRIAPTSEPEALRDILARVLPVRGIVRKRRWLYQVGQTRIHLDRVEGLGEFVELEVVLRAGQTTEAAVAIARDLLKRLDIADTQLVEQAYVDLLPPAS